MSKTYVYVATAQLEVNENGERRIEKAKLPITKFDNKETAIKCAINSGLKRYQKLNKKCWIENNELYVDFEDGLKYRFFDFDAKQVEDTNFKKAMRRLNKDVGKVMTNSKSLDEANKKVKKGTKKTFKIIKKAVIAFLIACVLISNANKIFHFLPSNNVENSNEVSDEIDTETNSNNGQESNTGNIYVYSGQPYIVVNNNIPEFAADQLNEEAFEKYSELDEIGRCQTALANISTELMPIKERESIGMIKPTGWQTINVKSKYNDVFDDGTFYFYNRCHLIGYQLAGENANELNLITGTRYLNVDGMLPFENKVAKYVKETGNHVLYRVTPDFKNDELVARGVQIEAQSVEDDEIRFNVYCFNVQPGYEINYKTGNVCKN